MMQLDVCVCADKCFSGFVPPVATMSHFPYMSSEGRGKGEGVGRQARIVKNKLYGNRTKKAKGRLGNFQKVHLMCKYKQEDNVQGARNCTGRQLLAYIFATISYGRFSNFIASLNPFLSELFPKEPLNGSVELSDAKDSEKGCGIDSFYKAVPSTLKVHLCPQQHITGKDQQ